VAVVGTGIATDTTPERPNPGRHVRKRTDSEGMVRIELRLQPDEAAQFYTALHEMKRRLSVEGGDDVPAATRPAKSASVASASPV
jgi:hypothetical protein